MNPWAVWLDPWEANIEAWSRALGSDMFRLNRPFETRAVTSRHGANPFRIALEGDNFALLDFSGEPNLADGTVTLVVTPYALHDWRIADLAHGHSLVEVLAAHGISRLYVLAWKSAHFEMRHNRIDALFEALKHVSDYFREPLQAVGLCQGGWLALTFAARFPETFKRIALIGSPIDFKSAAHSIPIMDDYLVDATVNWLALAGGGVIRGWSTQSLFQIKFGERSEWADVLQMPQLDVTTRSILERTYADWNRDVIDLPPAYFADVLKRLYRDNDIVTGQFRVLGESISLSSIRCPLLIMYGSRDEIVPAPQMLAVASLVSTPKRKIVQICANCGHLALFLGHTTLDTFWPKIANWLARSDVHKDN